MHTQRRVRASMQSSPDHGDRQSASVLLSSNYLPPSLLFVRAQGEILVTRLA